MTNKAEKIDQFFPAKNNTMLHEFMSNEDGRYEDRMNAFSAYVSGICHPTETNLRKFSDSLMDLLLDREYIKSHKWVFSKYY